jgi:CBS domain-containing protein
MYEFGNYKNDTVEQAGFIKSIFQITINQSALAGFQKMRGREVHAVAVVDNDGKLVANLSNSDLRGFNCEKMKLLALPVLEFLKAQQTLQAPITCLKDDTVASIIKNILQHHVHHIWVVDATQKPVGVVSLCDIALLFFNNNLNVWYGKKP